MKCSANCTESGPDPPTPFAREGGLSSDRPAEATPLAALDDLMAVVESLCPVPHPEQRSFKFHDKFLL